MNKETMWIFVIVLVGGVFYIAFVEKGSADHLLNYMSAISLVFITVTLMHISNYLKKISSRKK